MLRIICSFLVLFLATGVLLFPEASRRLVGLVPLADPSPISLDQLEAASAPEPGSFFEKRAAVEITVPRDMPLDELLRLYHIRLPHVRDQIEAQVGGTNLSDDHMLLQGTVFRITLVPPHQ